jgi:hypothetical protein
MRKQHKARDDPGKSQNDQLLEEFEEIIKGGSFYFPYLTKLYNIA